MTSNNDKHMNKHIKYAISAILVLASGILPVSCKKEMPKAEELQLGKDKVELMVGETRPVKIISGNGDYEFTFSNERIASAEFDGEFIQITGLSAGETEMTVRDGRGKQFQLPIVVNANMEDVECYFSLGDEKIDLYKDNGWSVTETPVSVAVMNPAENRQIILSSDKDLKTSGKENLVLQIVENGKLTYGVLLQSFSVADHPGSSCEITFKTEDQKDGKIVLRSYN